MLTSDQLFDHFRVAALRLRDAGVAGDSILRFLAGMICLKRISDDLHERIATKNKYPRLVPEPVRWHEIQDQEKDIGRSLNKACRLLESVVPALSDVFQELDFNRAGDNATLRSLVAHFSTINLSRRNLEQPHAVGTAFIQLMELLLNNGAGHLLTPPTVASLVAQLVDPKRGERIGDPCSGTGLLLIAAAEHAATSARQQDMNDVETTLEGMEINRSVWSLSKINLFLHDLAEAEVNLGDSLSPAGVDGDHLRRYDCVVSAPPFGFRLQQQSQPPFSSKYQVGAQFLQLIQSTLKPHGRAGVVVLHGMLFHGADTEVVRKTMIEADVIEAVIALPGRLMRGTALPLAVVILNCRKPTIRKGQILFIDASQEFTARSGQTAISLEGATRIIAAYRNWATQPGFSYIAPLEEIRDNDANLRVGLYVDATTPGEIRSVADLIGELEAVEERRDAAAARMDELLRTLGYRP